MSESVIDKTLRIARDVQPDLWARTEAVARIIDPAAFEDGWTIVEPESARRLHDARLKVLQANAMRKAQDVLAYLGVNTETDWFTILQRLAQDDATTEVLPVSESTTFPAARRGQPSRVAAGGSTDDMNVGVTDDDGTSNWRTPRPRPPNVSAPSNWIDSPRWWWGWIFGVSFGIAAAWPPPEMPPVLDLGASCAYGWADQVYVFPKSRFVCLSHQEAFAVWSEAVAQRYYLRFSVSHP